jgi:hypothetical protein
VFGMKRRDFIKLLGGSLFERFPLQPRDTTNCDRGKGHYESR